MPIKDRETLKRYGEIVKALMVLNTRDTHYTRSLITSYNDFLKKDDETKVKYYEELATRMIKDDIFEDIMDIAANVILIQSHMEEFFINLSYPVPPVQITEKLALVDDYCIKDIENNAIKFSTSKVKDVKNFMDNFATEDNRYFIILDEKNNKLKGIISINDITENMEDFLQYSPSDLATSIKFFNEDPITINNLDTMLDAKKIMIDSKRKITKLIVLDNDRKLVGTLSRFQLLKWANQKDKK